MEFHFKPDRGSPIPLYAQLAQALKDSIRNGDIAFQEKLPSENELVAHCGLSRMTVRSALSSLCSGHYIEKIQGKGAFACYRPPAASGSIDVLLDISYTYFAAHYIQSISHVLSQLNYRFIIHDSRDSQQEICSILSRILQNGSSGILLQPSHREEPVSPELRELVSRIAAQGIPYLMLDHAYEGIPGPRMVFDDYGGGRVAAEHLLSLGHRRCAMVCCSSFAENRLRREGFDDVLRKNGLPALVCMESTGELQPRLLSAIRDAHITAFFCFNDEVALKVIRALHSASIRIPQDVSVVGYDDTIIAVASNPQLTSVVHPKDILGRMAAEKIISLAEKRPIQQDGGLITPRIHARASSARCPCGEERK